MVNQENGDDTLSKKERKKFFFFQKTFKFRINYLEMK